MFAQRAGNLLDGGKIFVDDFFRFFGNLLFLHFHVGHVFDNAADYLLFVDVEDDDVKQFVVETDMFAMNVLFQIQRGRKQIGKVDEVAQVGAVQVVLVVDVGVFVFVPEGFDKFVVVFHNAESGIGNDNR